MCVNNANRPKLIITITIKKKRKIILKGMFEKKQSKNLYVSTLLYMIGKIFVHYAIVR